MTLKREKYGNKVDAKPGDIKNIYINKQYKSASAIHYQIYFLHMCKRDTNLFCRKIPRIVPKKILIY